MLENLPVIIADLEPGQVLGNWMDGWGVNVPGAWSGIGGSVWMEMV